MFIPTSLLPTCLPDGSPQNTAVPHKILLWFYAIQKPLPALRQASSPGRLMQKHAALRLPPALCSGCLGCPPFCLRLSKAGQRPRTTADPICNQSPSPPSQPGQSLFLPIPQLPPWKDLQCTYVSCTHYRATQPLPSGSQRKEMHIDKEVTRH